MIKYYVIKWILDSAFWCEEKQSFEGWNQATKYYDAPIFKEKEGSAWYNEIAYQLSLATQKKPCCVVEVYLND